MRTMVVAMGALALAGCASREHPVPLNTYQPVTAAQLVMPSSQPTEYRINPLDVLRVDVFGETGLTFQALTVSPTGTIELPLAGRVQAAGRTTRELTVDIAAALNRYLRRPQVAVNVGQYASQKVTVSGAVRTPGVFQALGDMTLMDAIALGQGVNDYSKSDEIVVFRRQGAQRYIARFDLGAIQRGEAADPTILPGDTVVVGYSASRRLFSDGLAVLPAAVGIFLAILN